MSVCLGAADSEREGKRVLWTALNSHCLRIPDFKSLLSDAKKLSPENKGVSLYF